MVIYVTPAVSPISRCILRSPQSTDAMYRDAAASAINVIASIIGVEINVGPLYDEAGRIEKQLQKFHKQAKPMVSDRVSQPSMYG